MSKLKSFQPPYIGAAYYPEDFAESEMPRDIQKMKEAGFNIARIGEFAWKKMEPEPGRFDFEWLHKVVDALYDAGIAVVMGTPTATPPKWLSNLYPDVMRVNTDGRPAQHGGRRHCCSNNPRYREYSARIVTELAKEFGKDKAIVGWQIDNEIYAFDGCSCPHCIEKFHNYLKEKYGTADAVNAAWNLNLFSQAYEDFSEIPAPLNAWHNPHLKFEWSTFANVSHAEFVKMQAEILHEYVGDAPIGTDIMPVNGMDYRELNEALDVVQFNHYNIPSNEWQCCFWFDRIRNIKKHPFWNTETQTCWNGSEFTSQSVKPDGWCAVNTFLPIALGGEANMYWLWRTHWAGHELAHGAVLDTSGRPMLGYNEAVRTAELIADCADFLNETQVTAEVAFHYTSKNWNMHNAQSVVEGAGNERIPEFYKPLSDCGVRVDVIDGKEPLDRYKLLVSPLMMTLEEGDLPSRIKKWVEDGGTWIVGPLSDIRNSVGARYCDRPFGMLEELTGAKWLYGVPDLEGRISAVDAEGNAVGTGRWYDVYDAPKENVLLRIVGGHGDIDGKACAVRYPVGKGTVILLGTFPNYSALRDIYTAALNTAGVENGRAVGELTVVPREGNERRGLILVEYAGGDASYTLPVPMKRVDNGETLVGEIRIPPYGILVLENT